MPSYKSSDLSEGLFAGKATLAKFYWSTFDYNGTVKPAATVLCVDVVPEEGEPFTQRWSAGKGWDPTPDGKDLAPQKGKKNEALSAQCGAGMLIRSLFKPMNDVDTGLDESIVDNDISVFNGTVVDLVRQERERRGDDAAKGGLTKALGKDEPKKKEGDSKTSILLVGEVLEPGPAFVKGGKSKSASDKPNGKAGKAVQAKDEDDEEDVPPAIRKKAVKTINKILSDHGEEMTIVALGKKVFATLKGDDDQQAIAKLAADDAFLGNDSAPWTFDGDTIKA